MPNCRRCGQEGVGLEAPPYPGLLGEEILKNSCPTCWEEWRKFSVKVINDHRLKPFLPKDRALLEQNMIQFLNLGVGLSG